MGKKRGSFTPDRRAAWGAAIAKNQRGEEVPPEEHYALLREDMFAGEATADVMEEADLFLRYWCHGLNIDALTWLGPAIAYHWFELRGWDRLWGGNRAGKALQDYIAADDYEHWTALNEIAARLQHDREHFPDALADWDEEVHRRLCDGTLKTPTKEHGNKGQPPYAHEDRNNVYAMADNWLEHFGMSRAKDRLAAIAGFAGSDEDTVRKALKRWRNDSWRRAPWPQFPTDL